MIKQYICIELGTNLKQNHTKEVYKLNKKSTTFIHAIQNT